MPRSDRLQMTAWAICRALSSRTPAEQILRLVTCAATGGLRITDVVCIYTDGRNYIDGVSSSSHLQKRMRKKDMNGEPHKNVRKSIDLGS